MESKIRSNKCQRVETKHVNKQVIRNKSISLRDCKRHRKQEDRKELCGHKFNRIELQALISWSELISEMEKEPKKGLVTDK